MIDLNNTITRAFEAFIQDKYLLMMDVEQQERDKKDANLGKIRKVTTRMVGDEQLWTNFTINGDDGRRKRR